MGPSNKDSRHDNLHTFGFAVIGANRGRTFVWVEATSLEAGRVRLAPLFPGCSLNYLATDGDRTPPRI